MILGIFYARFLPQEGELIDLSLDLRICLYELEQKRRFLALNIF